MSDKLQQLFLVRHGETAWSDSHRHTGLTDVPLDARGEQQAIDLAQRLDGRTFSKVFTSPLQRAEKTCELAGFSKQSILDNDLLEWDYGDYEGRTTAEIQSEQPGWNVFTHPCPNGETLSDIEKRADDFIAKVRANPGDVIAFSSSHIIRAITARWLGLDASAGRYFLASTATLNILGFEHDRHEPVICQWSG